MAHFLASLLTPYGVAGTLLLAALVARFAKSRKLPTVFTLAAIALVMIFSLPVVADSLLYHLEARHRLDSNKAEPLKVDALVLLAGGLSSPSEYRERPELGSRGDRLLKTFELYQSGRSQQIIISGADKNDNPSLSEPELTKTILVSWGIPENAIVLETRSTDTRNSVVELAKILTARDLNTILVITSGYHMPRAMGLFSSIESVEAYPAISNTLIGELKFGPASWIPNALSSSGSSLALHEYLGMAYNLFNPLELTR